ncbi:hypothetical protein L596_029587 [Steinernema carpocapsae]|uniref:F-box associated domain-containing protein n=1 Tax=Steinernema carpocapsae TaxID=34508 RepID=A0A4U5LV41_STECR|nr:hypothetical protein L596_029587 [Steinernema carpocapsae]
MDHVPHRFIEALLPAVSVDSRFLKRFTQFGKSWTTSAEELISNYHWTHVEIYDDSQKVVVFSKRGMLKFGTFSGPTKFTLNAEIKIYGQGGPSANDPAFPLCLDKRLEKATCFPCAGMHSCLALFQVNLNSAVFDVSRFFRFLVGPFRQISFVSCQGFANKIDTIVKHCVDYGRTGNYTFQNTEISDSTLNMLKETWGQWTGPTFEHDHYIKKVMILQNCTSEFSLEMVREMIDSWTKGRGGDELMFTCAGIKSLKDLTNVLAMNVVFLDHPNEVIAEIIHEESNTAFRAKYGRHGRDTVTLTRIR